MCRCAMAVPLGGLGSSRVPLCTAVHSMAVPLMVVWAVAVYRCALAGRRAMWQKRHTRMAGRAMLAGWTRARAGQLVC